MTTLITDWVFEGSKAHIHSEATQRMNGLEAEVVFTGTSFEVRAESGGDAVSVEIPVEVFDRVRGVK